jgi:CBS domain-containing protein
MRCEEIMRPVEVVAARDSIATTARRMRELNVGFLPICDDQMAVIGTVTDRDIVVRAVADDRQSSAPIEEIMTDEVVSCHPGDDVERAEELMRAKRRTKILCIDDDGSAAGIIDLIDLAQYEDPVRVRRVVAEGAEPDLDEL